MIFRSTMVTEAKRCIAKAYYHYELGLKPKGNGVNPDLFFGKAVHKAIEVALLGSLEDGVEYLESLLWPPSRNKSKRVALGLLRQFYHKFDMKFVSAEQEFTFPIDDDKWKGRYDIIAEQRGKPYVVELKTTNPYYLLTKPNDQFIAYHIGAMKDFGAQGFVLYNLDPNEMDIVKIPITFSEEDVEEWTEEFKLWKEYYKKCIEQGIYPRSSGACFDYNRKCEFHELCTSKFSMREKIMENCYAVDEEAKGLNW